MSTGDGSLGAEPHSQEDDSYAWFDVRNVPEFLAYLAVYDQRDRCEHGRLWTRCWECGHFEDCLTDIDADGEYIDGETAEFYLGPPHDADDPYDSSDPYDPYE